MSESESEFSEHMLESFNDDGSIDHDAGKYAVQMRGIKLYMFKTIWLTNITALCYM